MYGLLRPLLFQLDPEKAHHLALKALALAGASPRMIAFTRWLFRVPPGQGLSRFGLSFPNPIGLAAGYDKDGRAWRGAAALGLGHVEVGSVTLRAQPGNPSPRIFRLSRDRAVINRMGFPGEGADVVLPRLTGPRPPELVLGVNLGKNKDTPLEEAATEYEVLVERFAQAADYLVINVSSPNTQGLRRLQGRELLEALLTRVAQVRRAQVARVGRYVPLLVKLSPDLLEEELDDAVAAISATGMDGVIATNTSLARPLLRSRHRGEAGGLSGAPLLARSTEMVRQIFRLTHGRLPIVACGGVMCPRDAQAKLEAGACLVQLYTGMIYEGPGLPARILRHLCDLTGEEQRSALRGRRGT